MSRDRDFDLGIISLLNPSFYRRVVEERHAAEKRHYEWMLKHAKPEDWDDLKTKFKPTLFLSSKSWKPVYLFDTGVVRTQPGRPMTEEEEKGIVWCPGTRKHFFYVNQLVPAGTPLKIAQGKLEGKVYFDGDVVVPVLLEKVPGQKMPVTWMSQTPMEMLTQRKGYLLATGRVVVGGLGLGWFLNAVASKKSVTEVVVVDLHEHLMRWLQPVLLQKYPAVAEKVHWVTGNVYEFMEKDAARHGDTKYLLDIWPTYGGCDMKFYDWKKKLPGRVWGWGDIEY